MGSLLGRLRARPDPLILRSFAGEQVGPYRVRRLLAETAAGCVLEVEGGLLKLWLDVPDDLETLQDRADRVRSAPEPLLRVLDCGVLEARDFFLLQELPGQLLCDLPRPTEIDTALELADRLTGVLISAGDQVPPLFSAAQFVDGDRLDAVGVPLAPPRRHAALMAADVPLSRRMAWPVPPEAVADRPVDRRTSVWCLGYLVYELLIGSHPFSGLDPAMLALAPVMSDPIPPRQLNRAVPARIERLLLRTLLRDPASRPDLSTIRWLA
ncbi:MAG: hypothetical protein ACYCW6_13350 [Candidatus Xenobia bacterium]